MTLASRIGANDDHNSIMSHHHHHHTKSTFHVNNGGVDAALSEIIPSPLTHAISGSIGSALALLLFYPLERARIELQVTASSLKSSSTKTLQPKSSNNKSLKQEISTSSVDSDSVISIETPKDIKINSTSSSLSTSLSSCLYNLWQRNELYRGVYPIVMTLAISNFIFFYINEFMIQLLQSTTFNTNHNNDYQMNISTVVSSLSKFRQFFSQFRSIKESYKVLIASCLAGILNVIITNPLWVVNMRFVTGEAISTNGSIIKELIYLSRTEGISKLWTGTYASLLLVSNPIIQFFVYNQLKVQMIAMKSNMSSNNNKRNGNGTTLNAMDAFFVGAIAKAIATIVTYPLQLTQSLLRLDHKEQQQKNKEVGEDDNNKRIVIVKEYNGTWDCLIKIFHRNGFHGLFQGMNAKILQTVLTAAFTFLTYEQILHCIHTAYISTTMHRHNKAKKQ